MNGSKEQMLSNRSQRSLKIDRIEEVLNENDVSDITKPKFIESPRHSL